MGGGGYRAQFLVDDPEAEVTGFMRRRLQGVKTHMLRLLRCLKKNIFEKILINILKKINKNFVATTNLLQ